MKKAWIIGFGKVGRRALERLRRRWADAAITVVDPHLSEPPPEVGQGVRWCRADGVHFLLDRLAEREGVSPWIIPALPRHLAYAWIAAKLEASGGFTPCPVPEAVAAGLPNGLRGPEGQVYISIADFICPENCREPAKICPTTGVPRPFDLHAHLATLRYANWQSIVIRSHQLAPGLGGYRGRQLTESLATIQTMPGAYLLSTASKCHGVMHAIKTG